MCDLNKNSNFNQINPKNKSFIIPMDTLKITFISFFNRVLLKRLKTTRGILIEIPCILMRFSHNKFTIYV